MSDALSFADIDGQHVELLPGRTVLSFISSFGHPLTGDAIAVGGAGGNGGTSMASNVNTMSTINGAQSAGSGGAGGGALAFTGFSF